MLPVSVGSSFLEVSLVSFPAAAVAGLDPGQSFLCHGHRTLLQPEKCTGFIMFINTELHIHSF